MHLDPQKVEDIKTLEYPAKEAELQHLLRMVTYKAHFYASFIWANCQTSWPLEKEKRIYMD